MARVSRYNPPKFGWGYISEYPTSGRSFANGLRAGQLIAKVPTMADVPYQTYFDRGITHLIRNVGQRNDEFTTAKQACMQNFGILAGLAASKSFTSWTVSDVENAVKASFTLQTLVDFPGKRKDAYAFYLGQIMESLISKNICTQDQWNSTHTKKTVYRQIQQSLDSEGEGGRCFGDYQGHLDLLRFEDFGNPDSFRSALGDNGAALMLAKTAAPFGDAFYTGDEYQVRHGNIKIYHVGGVDAHKFVSAKIAGLAVDIRARQAVGTNRSVCVTGFAGFSETLNPDDEFSIEYARTVPAGGTFKRSTFPMWSFMHQIWLYVRSVAGGFSVYDWESEESFGRDPNVVPFDDVTTGLYTGSGATRAKTSSAFYKGSTPVGYPHTPMSGQDLLPIAIELVGYVASFAGGFDYYYGPHKYAGGSLLSVGSGYIIDRYQDAKGETLLFRQGNGNNIGVLYCATGMPPGTSQEIEIPMPNGAPLVFQAYAAVPYAFRVDLTQAS